MIYFYFFLKFQIPLSLCEKFLWKDGTLNPPRHHLFCRATPSSAVLLSVMCVLLSPHQSSQFCSVKTLNFSLVWFWFIFKVLNQICTFENWFW
jgi:hypothetical protein